MALFGLYDCTLGALTLKQCNASSFSWNNRIDVARHSGAVDPTQFNVTEQAPVASFTSHDIDGVLAAVSATAGLVVSSGSIVIPWQKRASGGTFTSGSAHNTISGANGLILPRRVRASQRDPKATVDLDCLFISSDGSTVPTTVNSSQALSATAYNVTHRLGPVKLDTVASGNVIGYTVNFGITAEPVFYAGLPFPQDYNITMRDPSIDLEFQDVATLSQFVNGYEAVTAVLAYLRKRTSGGTVVADGTAEHISFAFGGGIKDMQRLSASGNGSATATLRLIGDSLTVSRTATIA